MRVRKAVIPVAGLGTRLLPATKVIPKELVPVVAKPAVQWVVEAAVAAGVTEIIFVNSAGKHGIEDHFDAAPLLEASLEAKGKDDLLAAVRAASSLARIVSVRQARPLGLGHAVLQAREAVGDEPFAVILPDELMLGDQPALAQCLEIAEETSSSVIGIVEVAEEEVHRYGIVQVPAGASEDPRTRVIEDLVEKPRREDAPSRFAVTGPYVLAPEIFDELAQVKPGAGGEIQLTDALRALARSERGMRGRLIEGERLDVGHPLGFVQANVAMALADAELGPPLAAWLKARMAD